MNDNQELTTEQMLMGIEIRLVFRYLRQSVSRLIFGNGRTTLFTLDACCDNGERIAQHDVGIQAIPVNRIVGSVHGHADYDANFYPVRLNRLQWTQRCRACLNGEPLPVIKAVQVEGVYFVEAGHETVSLARVLGREYLDAQVAEVELKALPAPVLQRIAAPAYRSRYA